VKERWSYRCTKWNRIATHGCMRTHFFSFSVVNLSISFPSDVALARSMNIFKERLDKYFKHRSMIISLLSHLQRTIITISITVLNNIVSSNDVTYVSHTQACIEINTRYAMFTVYYFLSHVGYLLAPVLLRRVTTQQQYVV